MRTTDNNCGKLVSEIGFKYENEEDLLFIANKTIGNLVNEENLLIFPHSLNAEYKDLEADKQVFSIRNKSKEEFELHTGNVMGFIGRNNTQLTISSRFYPNENDWFLHYMLQKVFAINIFNLEHSKDHDPIWDFLLYLFPYYLKKALNQGLFKEYQTRHYNDANVKGPIDVARHIRTNYPFMGKIAYRTREHSYDNSINQLIRHTIEFIRVHKFGNGILFNDSDTQNAVNQIVYVTESYEKNSRTRIINKNLRPLNHPYFTEYALLQKICLQILRREGLTYGEKDDKVYGLLFDGSWLWEEYLNVILREYRFVHPENRKEEKGIPIFNKKDSLRFPDFYSEDKSIVLDAKYKRFEKWEPNRDHNSDLYQIITYLHCLGSKFGGLIFPLQESNNKYVEIGNLNGYGGLLLKIGLSIPSEAKSLHKFAEKIKKNEVEFCEKVSALTNFKIINPCCPNQNTPAA